MRFRSLIAFILLVSVFSCSRPASYEKYVKFEDREDGAYCFDIDMTDSLSCYDLSFYTRIDGKVKPASFPIDVRWVSPDGEVYGERAWFSSEGENVEVTGSFLSQQIIAPYRSGTVPVVPGVWTLKVTAAAPGMRGLGIILTKNPL